MKKLIAIILAMVMTFSVSVTAFAAEDLSAGSGESEIKTHVYSHYSITIPAVIDLRNGEIGQVTISDAMVEDNYNVKVFVTNTAEFGGIVLTHSNGTATINCSLLNIENNMLANTDNPLVSFGNADLQQGTSTKYFDIQADNYGMPGDYSGIMQYSFECTPNE